MNNIIEMILVKWIEMFFFKLQNTFEPAKLNDH